MSIYDYALSASEVEDLADGLEGRYEYHHTNALGSAIILTDDNENVLVRSEYDVFGAVRAEVGQTDNPRKFTGKEYDGDVKLYYYAARYYDPYIGRFTMRDPAQDGINWYAYVYNNPLKFLDPTGLGGTVIDGPRDLNELEAHVINFVYNGSVDPSDLQIQIVEDLCVSDNTGCHHANGTYSDGLISINANLYAAAGLNANSTLENTAERLLEPTVIAALSVVVHEAGHHWQKQNGWRLVWNPYEFNIFELFFLNLTREQMSSALQVYFIIAWQLEHGAEVVDFGTNTLSYGPYDRFTYLDALTPHTDRGPYWLHRIVSREWAQGLLGAFGPLLGLVRGNAQLATWGGIKSGG